MDSDGQEHDKRGACCVDHKIKSFCFCIDVKNGTAIIGLI